MTVIGFQELLEGANCQAPVEGLTHEFYKYPARFSPQFARSAIEEFSRPGEVVLDPFMGGGTSAVEALSAGRRFLGSDISSLSVFVTRSKTTPISRTSENEVRQWANGILSSGGVRGWQVLQSEWTSYQKNTPWWLQRAIDLAIRSSDSIRAKPAQDFARMIILRTAQWAMDCKENLPSSTSFFSALVANTTQMSAGLRDFRSRLAAAFSNSMAEALRHRRLIQSDAAELANHRQRPVAWDAPSLILTSPPYFGVHILYHRWQVQGRRETAAPFWISDSKDGMGASFYTFCDRQRRTMVPYLERLTTSFSSITKLMDKRSKLVQLVAFSDPVTQLELYLEALDAIGLNEIGVAEHSGRFWRTVPNRRWYAKRRGNTPPSKELLLIHKRR